MPRTCLAFLRFCLSAWIGIGTFFVLLVINLRQSELFPAQVKFDHPRVLFPLYYSFEFMLLGTALLCALACLTHPHFTRSRKVTLLALLIVAVTLAAYDFTGIYQPLIKMMATKPLPAGFAGLHQQSRWLNGVILALSFVAAWLSLGTDDGGRSPGLSPQA